MKNTKKSENISDEKPIENSLSDTSENCNFSNDELVDCDKEKSNNTKAESEEIQENSSPVCFANSKEVREDYK
jgi:hypothetical protein